MTVPDATQSATPASGAAVFSDCGLFRYRLERRFATGARVAAVIMVNPSTADGVENDHTIAKLEGFAARLDIGRLIVGNCFARVATDVRQLARIPDPVGPENDAHLREIMAEADLHIAAWGTLKKLPPRLTSRWRQVVAIAEARGITLQCWGTAQDGHPLHPLTLGYDTPLQDWRR